MSFNIVARAANDPELQVRIMASAQNLAREDPVLSETLYAGYIRNGQISLEPFHWAVADAVQAAYEAGVQAGRGAPGYDQDVVTDQSITDAVTAAWPPDPVQAP